jgi:uncharacterized Zn-finger protein
VKFNYRISDEENIIIEALDETEWKVEEKPAGEEATEDEVSVKCEMGEEEDLIEFENEMEEEGSVEEAREEDKERSTGVGSTRQEVRKVKRQTSSSGAQALPEDDEEILRKFGELKCEICSCEVLGWNDARQHYRSKHKRRSWIRCCGRKIELLCDMIEHVSWHRDPTIFSCRECGKSLLTRDHLKMHEAGHIPEELRQFQCPDCDKKFGSAFKLQCHKRNHVIEKLNPTIPCPSCPKKLFKSQQKLATHVASVHETGGPFMCECCSKVLKTKRTLEYHVRSHTQSNASIQCKICGHFLINKFRYAIHMNRHKEEEKGPYPCEECSKQGIDKKFKQKRQLQSHVLFVHTKRKFQCEECGKEFKQKTSLVEHSAQHTGIDKYSCQFCSRTFKSNANMYSHKKKMHKLEHATLPPPRYLRPQGEVDE